jgi:hypothetical protein
VKPSDHIEYVYDEVTGLYRRVTASTRLTLVFAREAHASRLYAALPGPCIAVRSRSEFMVEVKRASVAFVDADLLGLIDGAVNGGPIIGITDGPPSETLSASIRLLSTHAWLSHLVAMTVLSGPRARTQLATMLERLSAGPEQRMLGEAGIGRVALLAQASRREARFERIREFFMKHGLSPRVIGSVNDVLEELVTNALYDAPVEAGYFSEAVPRTEDVELPRERACEISYGVENGTVFLRVSDTFGALKRARLMAVLNRCNTDTVSLDESRGGAGLGMWRVFSLASMIAITVHPGCLTDIVVAITTKGGRVVTKQLQAVQLFFGPPHSDGVVASFIPETDRDLFDNSVTLLRSV